MDNKIINFYSRKDIQKEIVEIARNREVGVKYADKGYGKRPDIIQYGSDIKQLAQEGATSFHISEERWTDPLALKPGVPRKILDEIRSGFDLVFDVDCPYLEYSKVAAYLIVEALKVHDITSYGIKYSGNKGFHIIVPYEALPNFVNGVETRLLFPELPQAVISYVKYLIKDHLSRKILEMSTLQEISEAMNKKIEDMKINKEFNPYSILDIDTILISSRHLFRCVYSVNEKSGLVSIPIKEEDILSFTPSKAKISNVETGIPFFKKVEKADTESLIMQSFDFQKKFTLIISDEDKSRERKIEPISVNKVEEKYFPECIKKCLLGLNEDGRKRGVFVLINFFKTMNYNLDEIQDILFKWNEKNYQPLKEGYIRAQITWHKKNKDIVPPPNCSNEAYYKSMGIKCSETVCNRFKNPINYVKYQLSMIKEKKIKKEVKKDGVK